MNIDFVITWVDGNDPTWREEKSKWSPSKKSDANNNRYRDWDNLKYWFRSVEANAPWVHKIYFVTCGHYPEWLNLNHPKLAFVKHSDYIPAEYLPTFSSRAIDMNFHRIADLSEHFVYFNDDMFLLNPVDPSLFFKNNLPCDTAIGNALFWGSKEKRAFNRIYLAPLMDMILINQNFHKGKAIMKDLGKWFSVRYGLKSIRTLLLMPWHGFTGLMSYHLPYSYLKSTYKEVWKREFEACDMACVHKFRENIDVNHWLFSYWQIASGNFYPRNPKIGTQFALSDDMEKNKLIESSIIKKKFKMVCLNDEVLNDELFEVVRDSLNSTFEKIFPNKSSFEK